MEPVIIISAGSLALSVVTFLFQQRGIARSDTAAYIDDLEEKVRRLTDRVEALEAENLRLMKKLVNQ